MLPLGGHKERHDEIVQGCAGRAVVDRGGHWFAVTSLYLPPASRRQTLQDFAEGLAKLPDDVDEEWFMGT